jgi:ABC-2 type transport system ATP-binding protein
MIHAENLTRYYGDFCAVNGISFDIPKGEIVGLLGPNGAGKTTTLRMLTGFLEPSGGQIRINDRSLTDDPRQAKQMMGYLPESAPLYPGMLVYDYLNYVARIRGVPAGQRPSRIRHLAEICGLEEVMHKTVGELSKGYRQRVGLAHAMMIDPQFLVLDEPTSGLDPNQIVEIREIIRHIGREKTVILSTHILSEVEATCDRVVIVNRGQIVADDTTESLKHSVSGPTAVRVSLADVSAEAAIEHLSVIDGVATVDRVDDELETTLRILGKPGIDLRPAVYNAVKATDWVLLELTSETRSLEKIFQELTTEN